MELKILSLDGKQAGSATLSDAIFALEPRKDLIQRAVNWQLAKRQRGTHKIKFKDEINRTGKKMYRQKGTGSRPSRLGARPAIPRRWPRVRPACAQPCA